jgi:hypothetical protein
LYNGTISARWGTNSLQQTLLLDTVLALQAGRYVSVPLLATHIRIEDLVRLPSCCVLFHLVHRCARAVRFPLDIPCCPTYLGLSGLTP